MNNFQLKIIKLVLTVLVFLISISISAQNITVSYLYSTDSVQPIFKKIFSKTSFNDSLSLSNYLGERLPLAYQEGFLELSVDSLKMIENKAKVYIYVGQVYESIQIRYDENYEGILRQVNSKYLLDPFVDVNLIQKENKKITRYLENNAYPFSKVQLDSVQVKENQITAFLLIERGDKILYDSVNVIGDLRISKSFLYGYTGVKPNSPYNAKRIEELRKQMNDLPFARQSKETQIVYTDKKVKIEIPANRLSNNRFDGILGILPNDETTGKLVLTGELNIFLQNMLRSAEELSFKWQKLESSSQQLDIDFKIPYVFNTNLGLSAGLNLHKQDTTYLNSELLAGVQFYFQGQNNLGLQYKSKTSSILSSDTVLIAQFKPYHLNSYGLTFNYKKLDYYFNPHQGIDFSIEANVGNKSIENNIDISASHVQYDGAYRLKWFVPIGKKHTVLIANQAAILMSETTFANELYRIGGLNSIRGFMESSIYASAYSIILLEYRFVFERNSALFAFFDGAWYEKNTEDYYYDYPFGFGFGLFFKTNAGIFTISYAMGQQKNETLNIKNAKIHFGFINKF